MPEYKSPESDRVYGLHSNIPECCVDFYINIWTKEPLSARIEFWDRHKSSDFHYVPCVTCLETNNFKEIHRCDEKCKKFLIEEVGMTLERAEYRAEVERAWKNNA